MAAPGFGALLIVAVGLLAGGGYLIWRRPASKGEDLEDIPLKDVTVGEQPKKTDEDISAGDDVEARPPPVTPETPKNPSTPKTPKTPQPPKKKRLDPAKLNNLGTLARNGFHGVKESFAIQPPAGMAGSVC